MQADPNKKIDNGEENNPLPGNPVYPASKDIYSNDTKEPLKDEDSELGNELDVPGAELDDADERIGEEDEENNFYSLGGDEHNDLDETEDEWK